MAENGFILDDTTVLSDEQMEEYKRIFYTDGEDAANKYLEGIMKDW